MSRPPIETRYPLDPLVDAMGMSLNQACLLLGISGSTMQDYRKRGVTDAVAERLAVKAGFHPFEVWPELVDVRFRELERACDECGTPFVPTRKGHRFCTRTCGRRRWMRDDSRRRYWTDVEYRAAKLEQAKRWRADRSPAAKAAALRKQAAWEAANRERVNALKRARYARLRDEINARRRELYAAKKAAA